MRKVLILLTGFMLLAIITKAQWSRFTPALNTIRDISVVDENIVWLKDWNQDIIYFTLDGGSTWISKTLPNNITQNCGSLCAVSSTTAYITVHLGELGVYKTTNSGDTWVLQSTAFTNVNSWPDLIYFWNENEGVAIGDFVDGYFEIFTTTNGGELWSAVPNTNMPIGSSTVNANEAYRVHGNTFYFKTNDGQIFKSADKGLNWTVINTPAINGNISYDFKDDSNGVLSYAFGAVYKQYITSDGGLNWTQISTPEFKSNIFYIPSDDVYLATNYDKGLSYSTDNGNSWTVHPSFIDEGLEDVGSSNTGKIFIGSSLGKVYSTTNYTATNTTITSVTITGSNTLDVLFSAPIEQTSAENTVNYFLSYSAKSDISLVSATLDNSDNSIVHLVTVSDLPVNTIIDISVNNINDNDGNPVIGNALPSVALAIHNPLNNTSIKAYPNPVSNTLTLQLEGGTDRTEYDILNAQGQIIFKGSLIEKTVVQTSAYPAGIYLLKLKNRNSFEYIKIVKK